MAELRAQFRDEGVVRIERALDARGMALAHAAFQWSLQHPGASAGDVLAGRPGAFYQDHSNPASAGVYRELLDGTCIPSFVAQLLGSDSLWLLYEQIWMKDGGHTRRTPWHQDLAYIPLEGDHLAVVWLNLDPVPRERSLEFIRGSHRGPLFNPTAFDPDDDKASMFEPGVWPPLPDIEASRSKFPIASWAIEPGDLVVFHPAMLHGGAPTGDGERRRTISLRFFGDHAYCADRPENGLADVDRLKRDDGGRDPIEQMASCPPGTLFRHPGFPKVV